MDSSLWERYRKLKSEGLKFNQIAERLGISRDELILHYESFIKEYYDFPDISLGGAAKRLGCDPMLLRFLLNDELNTCDIHIKISRLELMKWNKIGESLHQDRTATIKMAMVKLESDIKNDILFGTSGYSPTDEMREIKVMMEKLTNDIKKDEEIIENGIEVYKNHAAEIPNVETHKKNILQALKNFGPMSTATLAKLLGFDSGSEHIAFYLLSKMEKQSIKMNDNGEWCLL